MYTRRNGDYLLEVVGHPRFGIPFGQDRLLPIWIATQAQRTQSADVRFRSAAEILDTFGLPKDGKTYRRMVEGFKRLFGCTLFWGTKLEFERAAVESMDRLITSISCSSGTRGEAR